MTMLVREAAICSFLTLATIACKGGSTKDQTSGSAAPPAQTADAAANQPTAPDAAAAVAALPVELTEFGTMLDAFLAEPSEAVRSKKACAAAEELHRKARAAGKAPPPSPAVADEWRTIMSDVLEGKTESLWMDCKDAPDDQYGYLDQIKTGYDRLTVLGGTAPAR